MSEAKKSSALAFWLGCATVAFVLMLVAVGGIMAWMIRREANLGRAALAPPAGWRDSLRARFTLPPEVVRLALPRTGDADAAELLGVGVPGGGLDSALRLRIFANNHVRNGEPLTPQDSATMRATFADSTLDRFVLAARQRRYEARLPDLDSIGKELYPPIGSGPKIRNLSRVNRASTGLTLRIRARLERRELVPARAEIGALFGVAALMWHGETTYFGLQVARRLVGDGARELKRYALVARDTAAAARAAVLEQWASRPRTRPYISFTYAYPDTALVVAADTTLPRGVRAEALGIGVMGSALSSLTRMIFGPPGRALRAVRALERDPDPAVSRAALVGDSTLTRLEELGIFRRAKLVLGLIRNR